jgi:hypothetical protein
MQIEIPISLDAPGVLSHYDALRLLRQFAEGVCTVIIAPVLAPWTGEIDN